MSQTVEDTIRSYLLGKLSPEEQQLLEERLLSDNELFEQLLLIEDDLVGDYVAGALSVSDRESADKHFLSTPQRRQEVRFARAMSRYIAERSAVNPGAAVTAELPQSSSWRQRLAAFFRVENPAIGFALTAALLISVTVCLGLWLRAERLQKQFGEVRAERDAMRQRPDESAQQILNEKQAQNEQLAEELRRERDQRMRAEQELADLRIQGQGKPPGPSNVSQPALFSVALMPGSVRSTGEMTKFSVPENVGTLQFRLTLPTDDYRKYRATIQTDEGQEILTRSNLSASAMGKMRGVIVSLPAKLLRPGDYQLKLAGMTGGGFEDVTSYTFRVLPK